MGKCLDIVFVFCVHSGTRLWTDVQKLGQEEKDLEKMRRVSETVQFDDILYTPFTSGTTGRPKAAMISHYAHASSFFHIRNRLCLTQQICFNYKS